MTPAHVRTLDDVAAEHVGAAAALFLKLDVQGFEHRVLDGAAAALPKINGVQVEMSLVPLYQGEQLFDPLLASVRSLGRTEAMPDPT